MSRLNAKSRIGTMGFLTEFVVSLLLTSLTGASGSTADIASGQTTQGLSVLSPTSETYSAGLITNWGAFIIKAFGNVSLEVWRLEAELGVPRNKALLYRLVSRTKPREIYKFVEGLQEFILPEIDHIRVERGDVIGLHYSDITTLPDNVTSIYNDSSCVTKSALYEALGFVESGYQRFTRVTENVCNRYLPKYTLEEKACFSFNLTSTTEERRVVITNGRWQPCWIFHSCDDCETSVTFDRCDSNDFLTVRNGNSSTDGPLPLICDKNTNKAPVQSKLTSYLHISFKQRAPHAQRIAVHLRTIQKGVANCTSLITDQNGLSVNIGSTPQCWVIFEMAKETRLLIEVSFSPSSRENRRDMSCGSSDIEFRDGPLPTSCLLYAGCPEDDTNTTSMMTTSPTVRITTHGVQDHKIIVKVRSLAKDSANCTVYQVPQYEPLLLTSPGYPHAYQPFTSDCWVVVSTSPHHRLLLTVIDSDLEPHKHCSADYVEVKDGAEKDSVVILRWCGIQHPASLLSTSSTLFIEFVTDRSSHHRGFKLTVQLIQTDLCSVRLADQRNKVLFKSTSFILGNSNTTLCWSIENKIPDHHIQVRIRQSKPEDCGFLEVRDGRFGISPVLFSSMMDKNITTKTVRSTGHHVYITYRRCLRATSTLTVYYRSIGNFPIHPATDRGVLPDLTTPVFQKGETSTKTNSPTIVYGTPRVIQSTIPKKHHAQSHLLLIIAIPLGMVTVITLVIVALICAHRRHKVGLTTVPIFDRTHPGSNLPMPASPRMTRTSGDDVIRCVCTGSHVTGTAMAASMVANINAEKNGDQLSQNEEEESCYEDLDAVAGLKNTVNFDGITALSDVRGGYTNFLYETIHKADSQKGTCQSRNSEATC